MSHTARFDLSTDAPLSYTDLGDGVAGSYLFLHGWPESQSAWNEVVAAAHRSDPGVRTVTVDLPGIGGSAACRTDGSKAELARVVHDLAQDLALAPLTLVGHDIGGMVAHAYLRQFGRSEDLRAVVMNTVIPGLDPWRRVVANPGLWHFALHSVPDLPEALVRGRQRQYFDYFFDALAGDTAAIPADVLAGHASAYAAQPALRAGFDFYRAFTQDCVDNLDFAKGPALDNPVLYLRGQAEPGIGIEEYAAGLRASGLNDVAAAEVPLAGHFAPEEAPQAVWDLVRTFSLAR